MNHPNWIYSVSIAVLCAYGAVASHAAQNAPTFMSKDGQIQSVNKYSSNPFWSPNSLYNQRIPTPIYANGPDLTTGDCNTVVKTLVASHCAARNNCTDLRISDVRPNIMVQLSQLPGHSYATSCGGYIDSAFENYKKTYGNVSAVNIVYSGNNKANNTLRLTPATYTPTETETRTAELERLQKETTPGAGIDATLFPKTMDDLSFTDRLANTTVGYEPYKNLESYKTPKFETETEYYERMKPLLEHQITTPGQQSKQSGQTNSNCSSQAHVLGTDKSAQNLNLCITSNFQTLGGKKYYSKHASLAALKQNTTDYNSIIGTELSDLIDAGSVTEFLNYTGDGSDWPSYVQSPGQWSILVAQTCDAMRNNEYDKETIIIGESACGGQNSSITAGEMSGPYCYCRQTGWIPQNSNDIENTIGPWKMVFYEESKHRDSAGNCVEDSQRSNDMCKYTCTKQCLANFIDGDKNLYIPTHMPSGGTTTCPDPHMNPADCTCPAWMNNTANPNKCECNNGKDPANNCEETFFMFWDCRGQPAHHTDLLNTRDGGDTGNAIRASKCTVNPGRPSTHNCIGMESNPSNGIINRLFENVLGQQIGRGSSALYLLKNLTANGYDFEISESEVDNFLNAIVTNITDVKSECTSTDHAWRLFVDKHTVSGNTHTYKPYKTICIGDHWCTPGEIKTH